MIPKVTMSGNVAVANLMLGLFNLTWNFANELLGSQECYLQDLTRKESPFVLTFSFDPVLLLIEST